MGSGLNKCFISNQSLPEEIPVVIFPIIQEKGLSAVKITKNNQSHEIDQFGSFPVGHNCFYKFQGLYLTGINKDGSKILLDETDQNKKSLILLCQYLYNEAYDSESEDAAFNFKKILKKHKIILGQNNKDKIFFFSLDDKEKLKTFNKTKMDKIFQDLMQYCEESLIYVRNNDTYGCFKFSICLKSVFNFILQKSNNFFDTKFNEYMMKQTKSKLKDNLLVDVMSIFFDRWTMSDSYNLDFSVYDFESQSKEFPKQITINTIQKSKEMIHFLIDLLNVQNFLNENNITLEPISGYKQDYQNDAGTNYLKLVNFANQQVAAFTKESDGE